jgi:hypothetical protein
MNRALTAFMVGLVAVTAALVSAAYYSERTHARVDPEPLPLPKRGVEVKTTAVLLDGVKVLDLLPLAEQAKVGVEARFKAQGPNDLGIVPLMAALKLRGARSDEQANGLKIELAAETPYRVLVEVLFSVGQGGVGKLRLSTRAPGSPRVIELDSALPTTMDGPSEYAAFFLVRDGIAIKYRGRNVAPGCDAFGGGVAIPNGDGYNLPGVVACLRRLNSEPSAAVEDAQVVANPGVQALTVLQLANTVRCGEPSCEGRQFGLPFMRRVVFGLPR